MTSKVKCHFFILYYSYVIVQGCILGSILNFSPQEEEEQ